MPQTIALQGNAGESASRHEPASAGPLRLLAPDEPPAQIAVLSPARRNALVACFNADGLHKTDGAWRGPLGGPAQSGVTIADLARDGMLTVTKTHRLGSAQLTERGNWFARTLLHCEATAE
jgi:hypothetical protein